MDWSIAKRRYHPVDRPCVAFAYGRAKAAPKLNVSKNLIALTSPVMRGPKMVAIQEALLNAAVHPGPLDAIYGSTTAMAGVALQAQAGIFVDPETRKALKLG